MQVVITEKQLEYLKYVCPPLTLVVWGIKGIRKFPVWLKEEWRDVLKIAGCILLVILVLSAMAASIILGMIWFVTGHWVLGLIVVNLWAGFIWFMNEN